MMYKVNNVTMAKERAKESNLSYGMSIFDGKWYVGSPEELKEIGVIDIDKSERKLNPIEITARNAAIEVIKIVEELGEQNDLDRYPGGLEGYIRDKVKQIEPKATRSLKGDDSMRRYYSGIKDGLEAVLSALQGDLEPLKYL